MIDLHRSLLAGLILLLGSSSGATEWEILSGHEDTEVIFRSEATLEDFEGRSPELRGMANLDRLELGNLNGNFEFELASLRTGIGLRDRHMRENVLHTEDFPLARLRVDSCQTSAETSLVAGKAVPVRLFGIFELHGVERPFQAEATLTLRGADEIRFRSEFEIRLADYGIKRPKMLMMKVAEVVQLEIRGLARRVPDQEG